MSELSDYKDRLDMREPATNHWICAEIARIDRAQAETQKFAAEQQKLAAGASNLCVTRFVTPVAAVVAALGALTAAAPVLMRCWQGHS